MAERSAIKLRALIVDGEDFSRRVLRSLLASDRDVEVVDESGSIPEARRKIDRLRPDLVFLDIGKPEACGVDLLRDVEARPYVICVTAHPEFALQAFELQADDLLLKPIERQRFVTSVIRARRRIGERLVAGLALQIAVAADAMNRDAAASLAELPASYPNHMMIRVRRRLVSLDVNDVTWIEGASQYSRVHTKDGEYLLSRTLGSLECELDPGRFLRVHRSAIVNASYVHEVRSSGDGRYYVYLRCGRTLGVGRTRRAVLERIGAGSRARTG